MRMENASLADKRAAREIVEERQGEGWDTVIALFDGGCGRVGIIQILKDSCDMCGEEEKFVCRIDGSEREYGAGQICLSCVTSAFEKHAR